MGREGARRGRATAWLSGTLALLVPVLIANYIWLHWHTPVAEFGLVWHDETSEPSIVSEVTPGGGAAAAGLRAGDVIVGEEGVPFPARRLLQVGHSLTLQVERDGRPMALTIPLVRMVDVKAGRLITVSILAVVLWAGSALLLWRRPGRADVRILFVLAQVSALWILYVPDQTVWCRGPAWLPLYVSGAAVFLFPALLLHFHLTFPVVLGTPRRRRRALAAIYGLAGLCVAWWAPMNAGWLAIGGVVWRVLGLLLALELLAAVALLAYVYVRRATPDGRRRLRLIVFGTALAAGSFALFLVIPAVVVGLPWLPEWVLVLFMLAIPLGYFYATARHSLFGIDRLLNRALVYGLLSLGILGLSLGPFLLLYRLVPGEPVLQAVVVAGLAMLVGLGFNWTRTRLQRAVDRLFYGGWYDYASVVEAVGEPLACSLDRDRLADVLIGQVPRLMQLRPGRLWIGPPGDPPPPGPLQFQLLFQGQPRGVWQVGPRNDGDAFTPADRRILATVAHQAETALGNVLLIERLRGQVEEIRHAQHQLLRSREQERARLARDLHDSPLQALIGLNLQLGLLLASQPPRPLADELGAVRAEIRQLLAELRRVCADLRPPLLDTIGLGAALRVLTEDWAAQHGVPVHLELPTHAGLPPLPDEVAVTCYRIAQEALSNVARHAAARQVRLCLAWQAPCLSLTVQDDGQGFVPADVEGLAAQGHFGLAGIQERVDLIGGRWRLDSAPGRGTTVQVSWQPPPAA